MLRQDKAHFLPAICVKEADRYAELPIVSSDKCKPSPLVRNATAKVKPSPASVNPVRVPVYNREKKSSASIFLPE